ncbi:glycosyltransferase [Paracoccus sp. DMF-8]|uniref:glycosyltransferase n=1 Tax=Paracoccus sp. DMF-8 TaxID=3019445 RepID=UPI0023E85F81|nr:glycosyltransferase [Paracoccus sp. DMF-8]MDF3606742.1 glycosyltransferase [Paracoccus sp. DMF-8]
MSFDAIADMQPVLTLFTAATASGEGDSYRLNDRFVEGMRQHLRDWPGPVRVVMRDSGPGEYPGSRLHPVATLDYAVVLLPPGVPLESALVAEPGVVMADADLPDHLPLARAARRLGLGVVFGVEQTLQTRLRAVMHNRSKSLGRRLWSAGWNLRQEYRLRRALRDADGVQLNGYPVSREYACLNRNAMRFLDNRMRRDMLADHADLAARRAYLTGGGPLRLVHSGRLEPWLGAQNLIPLADALRSRAIPFTLVIEGRGSLSDHIRDQIAARGLGDHVTLPGLVPFERVLVPMFRRQADLLISCRVQAEPSGVFVEAMASGLPVLGYENLMLSPLIRDSGGGWTVPMDDLAGMVQVIDGLNRNRRRLTERSEAALDYARRHDFETEFRARTTPSASGLCQDPPRADRPWRIAAMA